MVMTDWNPSLYGTFLDWRTRPSCDLAQRLCDLAPQRIVDLGCGPGNSTAICSKLWPAAAILGVDSSPEMIASARAAYPDRHWMVADIGEWLCRPIGSETPIHLIFSCAALQWVEDHATVFPRLLAKLAPGGVLAAHMPTYDAVPNQTMREMASSPRWRRWFPDGHAREWRSHSLEFYYTTLAGRAKRLDLWATDYFQVMPNVDAIVEWYKSTGLRPYLDCITDAMEREGSLTEYRTRLTPSFPTSERGGVPFVFRRIFIVAGV